MPRMATARSSVSMSIPAPLLTSFLMFLRTSSWKIALPKEIVAYVSQFMEGSIGTFEMAKALEEQRATLQKAAKPRIER